jgi:hypothetical protein
MKIRQFLSLLGMQAFDWLVTITITAAAVVVTSMATLRGWSIYGA